MSRVRREDKMVFFTALLLSLSNTVLLLLGESRVDVYVMIYILIYFVSLTLLNYDFRDRVLFKVNIALSALFLVIVAYRIWSILASSMSLAIVVLEG